MRKELLFFIRKTAFANSQQVVLKLDMASPDFMKNIMVHSYLKKYTDLKYFMDESEYELLDAYLKEKTGRGHANV